MHEPIKLVIADDHEVYRDGLKTLLKKSKELLVVGEASDGRELLNECKETRPDIVLTDIMMPVMNGIEATALITSELPNVRVIALSMLNQDSQIVDMLHAGAMGYLIKNADKKEILDAIRSVYKGMPYYCKTTSMKLARMIGSSSLVAKAGEKVSFNDKEIVVIKMICEEKTSKEIGDVLCVSPRTVEEYRERIKEKMGVKTSSGIVMYAVRNDLYPLK